MAAINLRSGFLQRELMPQRTGIADSYSPFRTHALIVANCWLPGAAGRIV